MTDETDTTSEVARVLGEHRIECTGLEGVTCRGCRERGWMRWYAFEKHQAAVLAEAGLLCPSALPESVGEHMLRMYREADAQEAQIATQEPAGATQGGSGDSRAPGGLDGAAVHAWPFAPGDVVRDSGEDSDHAAWLDAAPQRTVVVDHQGTEWVRLGDGWFTPGSPSRWVSLNLEQTYGPLSVISVGKDAP